MNSRSRASSCGSTRTRCTNAGYTPCSTMLATTSSPSAAPGSRKPLRRSETNRITIAMIETPMSRSRAGSSAFTSVNDAPVTVPRWEKLSS